jgi:hypothetical protein
VAVSKDIERRPKKKPERQPEPDNSKTRLLIAGSWPVIAADVAVVAMGHPEAGYCITGVWVATCAAVMGKWGRP